jgi:hypothetical protein
MLASDVDTGNRTFVMRLHLEKVEPGPMKKPRNAGLFHERRLKEYQSASAAKARAVMSSTLPVP